MMKTPVLILALLFGIAAPAFAGDEPGNPPPCPPPEEPGRGLPPPRNGGPEKGKHNGKNPGQKTPGDRFFSHFQEPDRTRLKKLAQENPEAFRKEIHEYFKKEREKEFQTLLALRMRCLKGADEAERESAAKELRAKLAEQISRNLRMVERRIADNEAQLAEMRKRLDEFKADYERRKTGMDAIVDKALKDFLDPAHEPAPAFRNPPPPPPRTDNGDPRRRQ